MEGTSYQNQYGIFISYKHRSCNKHLAGRIYDFFKNKGINPFMDDHVISGPPDWQARLDQAIRSAPYFLCVLTKDGARALVEDPKCVFYWENKLAVEINRTIIVLHEETTKNYNTNVVEKLPEEIREGFRHAEAFPIPERSDDFSHRLETILNCLNLNILRNLLNWRERIHANANVLMLQREELHRGYATLESRFGSYLVQSARNHTDIQGFQIIKEIDMACYAANLIFTPKRDMVDRNCNDLGVLFDIFEQLLKDDEFTLRLVMNAPGQTAAKDAIRFRKLGNSSFEEHLEAVFLSSYVKLRELSEKDPYRTARLSHRFTLTLTECVLPYSILHVIYKEGWEEFNHVKLDFYSFDIDSSEERRSVVIFERDNKENYDFFVHQFAYLRRDEARQASMQLIKENDESWHQQWNKLQMEIGRI